MSQTTKPGESSLGWKDKPADDPQVAELRKHLEAINGIQGLEILDPKADKITERAAQLFGRDGFVVIGDVLTSEQVGFLKSGCDAVIKDILALDEGRKGNRGSHRYSFGGSSMTRSQLHRPEWQMLLDIPLVTRLLTALFGSPDYILRAASGDFCLPGAVDYQRLHSDAGNFIDATRTPFSSFVDPRGKVHINDLPSPYICVNFLPQDVTRLNGPTRQIPGTQHSLAHIPNLKDEPEWMRLSTVCPAPAGAIMIRDVRNWHGGTPNLSDEVRSIPNLEFYAPWFREPIKPGITYHDFKTLPEHVQRLVQFSVADSSETLDTGVIRYAP